jgi:hypothetical protein
VLIHNPYPRAFLLLEKAYRTRLRPTVCLDCSEEDAASVTKRPQFPNSVLCSFAQKAFCVSMDIDPLFLLCHWRISSPLPECRLVGCIIYAGRSFCLAAVRYAASLITLNHRVETMRRRFGSAFIFALAMNKLGVSPGLLFFGE